MKKRQQSVLVLAVMVVFICAGLSLPGLLSAGNLEPSGPPQSTMKTLDQIPPTWSQKLQCDLFGDIVVCPRFELVMGGYAVLDKETGLVWEQSPGPAKSIWEIAEHYCYNHGVGGRKGFRLPTVEELASLVDPQASSPPYLPSGHPFSNVQNYKYWSSTTNVLVSAGAWFVDFRDGGVYRDQHGGEYEYYVWCVRGGHGYNDAATY